MKNVTNNRDHAYAALEREFESTLVNELIPGVLHNFANPLNGIMGRSKLLQRRMEEYFNKIEARCPDLIKDFADEQNKLTNDVNSICKESDRFFYMFQDLASKFYTIADKRFEKINLTNLIENELCFSEFYLDFKHEIKKNIRLTTELPYIYGTQSDYSLCFSALLRNSMYRMKKSNKKELSIVTDYKDNEITVVIQDSGDEIDIATNYIKNDVPSDGVCNESLASVKLLLKKYKVKCIFEGNMDQNTITIKIPVNQESLLHKLQEKTFVF